MSDIIVNLTVDFIAGWIVKEATPGEFNWDCYSKPGEQDILVILAKTGCGEFVFCGLKIKDWPHDMPLRVKKSCLRNARI